MKKEKKTHGVQLLIRAVVTDPDGKVISDTGRKPARSFVIQFLEFIHPLFTKQNLLATDTAGAETVVNGWNWACNTQFYINAGVGVDDYGIVIGTGDTAETNTDNKLETQLTEGLGAGNITHGAQVIGTTGVVGANVDFENSRTFTNNTGSTITVKEAGIYYARTAVAEWCAVRDVLPGSIDVPNLCSLTVYYTLRTTV